MKIPSPQEAYHKMQLYRLLKAIIDQKQIASKLCFKGGTCAALLGYLDRFSVDLDFDLIRDSKINQEQLRKKFHKLFKQLGLTIKDESRATLQFFLKYEANPDQRNTIRLDVLEVGFRADLCQPQYLADIDRYMNCQTIDTMFANKLVALIDRYEQNQSLAGRDLYDIHYFFSQGYPYRPEIIKERRGKPAQEYLEQLLQFIDSKITQTVIDQDLNTLLPSEKFQRIRRILKEEALFFLKEELRRLS